MLCTIWSFGTRGGKKPLSITVIHSCLLFGVQLCKLFLICSARKVSDVFKSRNKTYMNLYSLVQKLNIFNFKSLKCEQSVADQKKIVMKKYAKHNHHFFAVPFCPQLQEWVVANDVSSFCRTIAKAFVKAKLGINAQISAVRDLFQGNRLRWPCQLRLFQRRLQAPHEFSVFSLNMVKITY